MTDDDELLDRLRAAAEVRDPVPADVLAAARAALATRGLDEELVALTVDSALVGTGQVRGGDAEVRVLTFEARDVSLELQVEFHGDRVSIRGLATGVTGDVVVEVAGRRHAVPTDEGWFAVADLPRGATRVQVSGPSGPVVTSWVRL